MTAPEALLRRLTDKNPLLGPDYRVALLDARKHYSLPKLQKAVGVNRHYLWRIEKEPGYYPPKWVCDILGIIKPKRPRRFFIYPDIEHIDNTVQSIIKNMDPKLIDELISRLESANEKK